MPTYEYLCPKCGHAFEKFQSMSALPLKKCPQCGKSGVKRLIGGGAGLIFKGSGFYITDYKNKKQPAEKTGGAGEAKPTPVRTETKSEAKPAKPAAGQ